MKKLLILLLSIGFFSSCQKDEEIIIQNNCCNQQDSSDVTYLHYKTKLIYNDQDSNQVINVLEDEYSKNYFIFENRQPKRIYIDFEEFMPFSDVEITYKDSIYYPPLDCETKIWISNDKKEIQIIAKNPGSNYLFDKKRILYLKKIN